MLRTISIMISRAVAGRLVAGRSILSLITILPTRPFRKIEPPQGVPASEAGGRMARHAARYLSRHSLEQKWTNWPSMVFVMAPAVETYVPQTGSFFSSPPTSTVGDCRAVVCGVAAVLVL